ncbi:hypothetical protein D3C86_2008650 [compost metagenome]
MHCVLTDTTGDWHLADFTFAKDEGVQQFGFSAVQVACVISKMIIAHRDAVDPADRIIIIALVVNIVVPRRTTDPCAEILIRNIEL